MRDNINRKPPLGLVPEHIAQERFNMQRIRELANAIERYSSCSIAVPYAWTVELTRRLNMEGV